MYALLAFIPIIFVILVMVVFSVSSKIAITGAWVITAVFAVVIWQNSIGTVAKNTAIGFLESIAVLLIIFGAVLIMNTLVESGGMNPIKRMFNTVSPDARVQFVLIGFLFSAFLEGAAGFGVPAALAAPLMVSVGFTPLAATTLALVFNSVPVCFGGVGTPTNTALTIVSDSVVKAGMDKAAFAQDFTVTTAVSMAAGTFFILLVATFMLVKFFGDTPEKKKLKNVVEMIPFLIYVTVVFDVLYISIAIFFGPELVSLISAAIAMAVVMCTSKLGFLIPKSMWAFEKSDVEKPVTRKLAFMPGAIVKIYSQFESFIQDKFDKGYEKIEKEQLEFIENESRELSKLSKEMDEYWKEKGILKRLGRKGFVNGIPLFRAWVPYIIIGVVLALTRVSATTQPDGWAGVLKSFKFSIPDGVGGAFWSFNIFWNPGIIFIIVAILTILIHRMRKQQVKKAWLKSLDQIKGAAIPLLFGVAMVYVLRNSANPNFTVTYMIDGHTGELGSMLTMMADGLGSVFRSTYMLIAPVLGIVGSFISGSNTVSNTLFAGLQFETATMVGLSQVIILALQNCGGAVGNMVCINNAVAACATTNITGSEGRIIKMNFIPCVVFWIVLIITASILNILMG